MCDMHADLRAAARDAQDHQDYGGYRRIAGSVVETDQLPSAADLEQDRDERRVGEGSR